MSRPRDFQPSCAYVANSKLDKVYQVPRACFNPGLRRKITATQSLSIYSTLIKKKKNKQTNKQSHSFQIPLLSPLGVNTNHTMSLSLSLLAAPSLPMSGLLPTGVHGQLLLRTSPLYSSELCILQSSSPHTSAGSLPQFTDFHETVRLPRGHRTLARNDKPGRGSKQKTKQKAAAQEVALWEGWVSKSTG